MLTFRYSGADGSMTVDETITSGMVGKEVNFEFTTDWDNLIKTAVFTAGKECRIVPLSERNTIPAEVLMKPQRRLYVGIYGIDKEGSLVIPTVNARGPMIEPGADPSGDEAADPDLPIWAQLQAEIEALKQGGTSGGGSIIVDDDGYLTTTAGGFEIDADGYIVL